MTTLFNQPPKRPRFHREPSIHNMTFVQTMRKIAVRIAQSNDSGEGDIVGHLTVDDLREYADKHEIVPDHQNAWGTVFSCAPTGYIFKNTGSYVQSRYPASRGRRVATWAVIRDSR